MPEMMRPWRRMFTAGAVVAAVMDASAGARADYYSGNALYAACTSKDIAAQSICAGYVAAVADATISRSPKGDDYSGSNNGMTHCPREGATLEQDIDVVTRFLAAFLAVHSKERNDAVRLVSVALAEAFPCSK